MISADVLSSFRKDILPISGLDIGKNSYDSLEDLFLYCIATVLMRLSIEKFLAKSSCISIYRKVLA